jgi:hypothetical protein
MWIRLAVGFFALSAAVAPGPPAWAQDVNALIERKAALEAQKSVLTLRKELATL